ncbi:MAG: sterol desaturase family protein, partial [Pseudomonadota bacterium]
MFSDLDFFTQYETWLRASAFLGILALLVGLEYLIPRRQRVMPRVHRWTTNLTMVVLDTIILRYLFTVLSVGMAFWANQKGIGLFNLWEGNFWLKTLLTVLIFDFLIYLQHVVSHRIPFLWRIHRVHHVDRDIDVTTALRFHPIEITLSMLYKFGWILILGPTAFGMLLFGIILNSSAMFNHANIQLPPRLDHFVRLFVVTPDMHHIHHSTTPQETNSNYGSFLSLWDRLCRTYKPA